MRIGPTLLQISLSNENQEREGKWKGWQIKTMKQNAIKEGEDFSVRQPHLGSWKA